MHELCNGTATGAQFERVLKHRRRPLCQRSCFREIQRGKTRARKKHTLLSYLSMKKRGFLVLWPLHVESADGTQLEQLEKMLMIGRSSDATDLRGCANENCRSGMPTEETPAFSPPLHQEPVFC
jgi:hypothetical protein